jgi:leucyl/phenylalanyl-tRNA--protein transferase
MPSGERWHDGFVSLSHAFGPEEDWPEQDLVALSDDFNAELVLEAYRAGVFPMPLQHSSFAARMGWWSPVRRAYLPLDELRVTRSLRKMSKRYRVTVDRDFDGVIAACGDLSREGGWIDDDIRTVYSELHRAGSVHSVETWDAEGRLVGGLYGVSLGGLFAGESMFHDAEFGRDASKVALMELVRIMGHNDIPRLLDVQWLTPHLESLGAAEISRHDYLELLDLALDVPAPPWS